MDDDVLQLIEDCENREDRLSAWEHDFILSVRAQLEAGRTLSPKQQGVLDGIWERVTAKG